MWTSALSCIHSQFWPNSFRLSPHSQLQSYGLASEAWVLAPSPCMHRQICITGWGVQWGGPDHLCFWSLFCLPQGIFSTCRKVSSPLSSEPLKLPFCPGWSPSWWMGVPRMRDSFPFTTPSQGHFKYFPLVFSILLKYMVIILATVVVWDPLSPFNRYSMRTVSHVNVFVMYLWE